MQPLKLHASQKRVPERWMESARIHLYHVYNVLKWQTIQTFLPGNPIDQMAISSQCIKSDMTETTFTHTGTHTQHIQVPSQTARHVEFESTKNNRNFFNSICPAWPLFPFQLYLSLLPSLWTLAHCYHLLALSISLMCTWWPARYFTVTFLKENI